MATRPLGWLAVLGFTWSALGCGKPAAVEVKGTVQKNGKAYAFAPGEEMEIVFAGSDASGRPINAVAEMDTARGTFRVGSGEAGIPPGVYKIAIRDRLVSAPKFQSDRLRDAFTPDKTPLSYTVGSESPQEIVIDVGKKTVTPK